MKPLSPNAHTSRNCLHIKSGYQKLAAATMATLFWAGGTFAWKFRCQRRSLSHQDQIEEVSIQEYLQGAYIEAFGKLADALTPLEACVGFEVSITKGDVGR